MNNTPDISVSYIKLKASGKKGGYLSIKLNIMKKV